MVNAFSLGKNSKFGEIDFSKLKSGISKKDLGIEEGTVLANIFDSINTNNTGESRDKLDRQELNAFIEKIRTLCDPKLKGDTNLSEGEAKKFQLSDDEKLGRKHKKELLNFLSNLSKLTNGVNNIKQNAQSEIITYEDGHTEEVFPDGKVITTVIDKAKGTKTVTIKNTDGSEKVETTETTDDGEIVTVTENGKPVSKTITKQNQKEVINYTNGTESSKTINYTSPQIHEEYTYENGQAVLKKRVNSETNETTHYDGNKEVCLKEEENGRTITTKINGKITNETIVRKNNNNETEVTDRTYDRDDYTEEFSVNNKPRSQTKVIDGQTYSVEYDEDGNTLGIIVQNGESIQAIAKKFDIDDITDLIRVNSSKIKGKYPNAYFQVGEEIKIPRKMEADEEALQGRKSKEECLSDYNAAIARREAERQARIGDVIVRGDNGYYVTITSDGNLHYWDPKNHEISENEFAKYCPTIHRNVTQTNTTSQTTKTRKKYDTAPIRQEAEKVAAKIREEVCSKRSFVTNAYTLDALRNITPENAAYVVDEYRKKFGVSLAKDIDDESGLNIKHIKEFICSKLMTQADRLGLSISDYESISDLNELKSWINKTSGKIISEMDNATETYAIEDEAKIQKRDQQAQKKKTNRALANSFYSIYDNNSNGTSSKKALEFLKNNVSSSNIVEFLEEYSDSDVRKGDSSIIHTITSEYGDSQKSRKAVLTHILSTLITAARAAGVSEADIDNAHKTFIESMNKEFAKAIGTVNPTEMEKAMDSLLNAIRAKKHGDTTMSDEEAQAEFTQTMKTQNQTAQESFNNAREEEGWCAKTGDWVCGLFGCNTVDDLRKKLGTNAAAVEKIVNAKTYAEFTKAYEEFFGVPFDKNKVAAYSEARNTYIEASGTLALIQKVYPNLLNKINSNSYESLKADPEFQGLMKSMLGDELSVDDLVAQIAQETGRNANDSNVKKAILKEFIEAQNKTMKEYYSELTQYQSIDEMKKDMDSLDKAALGTKDIVKDVNNFNENMILTELVTEGVFEIAATIALSAIPGGAVLVAARGVRVGAKAAKFTKLAAKAEKAYNKIKAVAKTEKATAAVKATRAATAATNAGAATMAVDLSDKKSFMEAGKKALMNMTFASVGAGASLITARLTPILTKAGITNKVLQDISKECLEEVLNAGGSYVVTVGMGDEYGLTDAGVDFLLGMVFARISHIKFGNSKPEANANTAQDSPSSGAAERGHRDAIADAETARNSDQSHLNANERQAVEEGTSSTPTQEELDAYQREHGYQEPTTEERAAIDENNARAAEANSEAHRVENNISEEEVDALNGIIEQMDASSTPESGIFRDREGNEYTIKDGKVTEIKTHDGRIINDELKIAKFTSKRNIQIEDLQPVKVENQAAANTKYSSFTEYTDEELAILFSGVENGTPLDRQVEFQKLIEKNYDDLRLSGKYTEAESVNGNFEDIYPWNYKPSKGVIVTGGVDDWIWHRFDNGCLNLAKDRVSLSVKADRKLLEELDQLLLKGTYKDANGKTVKIPKDKFTKGMYKTDITIDDWCQRHDPITMYFDETVSQEMLDAIAAITDKYKRMPQRPLQGAVDGTPWMAHEHYTTQAEIDDLVSKAKEIDPDLARTIKDYLGTNASTGMFTSCEKLLDDYKRYKGIKTPEARTTSQNNNIEIIDAENAIDVANEVKLIDLDGADDAASHSQDSSVHSYRHAKNPNAELVDYSYNYNGKTYSIKAPKDSSAINVNYLFQLDLRRRILFNGNSSYQKLSQNTQILVASYAAKNKANLETINRLVKSVGNDEQKLLSILKDEKLFTQRIADIEEVSKIFPNTNYYKQYLGGLLDLKALDPSRYKKIADSGIFELINQGKLDIRALKQLGVNADLSSDIYKDLAMLKSGKSIVPEFSANTNLKTAFEQTSVGDVLEVGNKMYINDGTQLIEWNMTKEKYLELFPPVERFATVQGSIGNCYLIQTLGLAMHNPQSRVQFLQSFTLNGNDVVVTVKGYENYHGSRTFPNGELEQLKPGKRLYGSKGMQMYEETYGRVALREASPVDYPGIAPVEDVVQRTAFGQSAQAMADVFGQGHIVELYDTFKNRRSVNGPIHNSNNYSTISFENIPYNQNGKTVQVNLNNQKNNATKIHVFDRFFKDFPEKTLALKNLNLDTTELLLEHAANNPNYIISFGTPSKPNTAAESTLLSEYNLVSSHAYSILGYDTSTKMVQIVNPHSFAEVTEIPLETLHKYIEHLDFLKL